LREIPPVIAKPPEPPTAARLLREHAVRVIAVRDHRRAAVEQDVAAEAAAVA
jgi:hypothetical protein